MQNIDMWLETTREFLHRIAAFLPLLAVGIVVVLLGWLFAKAVRFAVEKALRAVNFNILTERAGTDHFLRQGGLQGDTTTLFGMFTFWVVIIASLIIAFNVMGLTYITDLLQRVELFMPKVLVAMLVVVLGSYFAKFIGDAVHTYCVDAQIPDSDILGRIARYLIMTFVIMIALSQIEVGGDIVQRTFLIILFGLVLALALAFGLGGKEWAAAMLERWWPQRRKDDR
jgi:Conserved TM helix